MGKPIIIEVNNLSKLYHLGLIGATSLRDSLGLLWYKVRGGKEMAHRVGARQLMISPDDPQAGPEPNTIWALRDVSFSVEQGEILGIIGKNGAGKSTLLKILSRITEPTEGKAIIHGRTSSLLEVGTGFHPELTGKENIYLNGAILGMRKSEIDRKLDEIVAFAEIEKFIDTPVKRYSSGMYVRLAFAVAAHLEPEILLIDEVLAVGDAAFQEKCLGKMGKVAREGRTVLFVSHNMASIESLCSKVLLIEQGRIKVSGHTQEMVSAYLAQFHEHKENLFYNCERTGNGKVRVLSFRMETPDGRILQVAKSGTPVIFSLEFENRGCELKDKISFSFSVQTDRGVGLFCHYSHFSGVYYENLPQRGYAKCLIPEIMLAPGNYFIMCRILMNGDIISGIEVDWPQVYVPITVIGGDFYGTGDVNTVTWGPILVKGTWSVVGK